MVLWPGWYGTGDDDKDEDDGWARDMDGMMIDDDLMTFSYVCHVFPFFHVRIFILVMTFA